MRCVLFVFGLLWGGATWAVNGTFSRRLSSQYQTDKLTASDATGDAWFGSAVAIAGNVIVVGAFFDDDIGTNSGSAYVFQSLDTGGWTEVEKLTASDAAAGDRFGTTVAIASNIIVVGAPWDDDAGIVSGSAYVFRASTTETGQKWRS